MAKQSPFLSLFDYASVVRIDGLDVPNELLPKALSPPLIRRLIEVPIGKHVVEILDKEDSSLGWITVEKERRSLEFQAQPGRTYMPFVDDVCRRKWFWIADTGAYDPQASAEDSIFVSFALDESAVVTGEPPPKGPCAVVSKEE